MPDKKPQFCFITWKNIEKKKQPVPKRWQPSTFMPRRLRLTCLWWLNIDFGQHFPKGMSTMKCSFKSTINAHAIAYVNRWQDNDFWNLNALHNSDCVIKPLTGCTCMHLSVCLEVRKIWHLFIQLWKRWKYKQGNISHYICSQNSVYHSVQLCNLNLTLWTVCVWGGGGEEKNHSI